MADCFVTSPLSMASLQSPLSSTPMPLGASAAGGDALTPLSALGLGGGGGMGGGALMPMDGNQAAYMPPTSVPSSTALAVEAEPDDDGVRALQLLECLE